MVLRNQPWGKSALAFATMFIIFTLFASYASAELLTSNPPAGTIDARGKCGVQMVEMVFDGQAPAIVAGDIGVTVNEGFAAPGVLNAWNEGNTIKVALDKPIPQGAWTTIGLKKTGEQVCIGSLPGDANQNKSSNFGDIIALIDCLRKPGTCNLLRTDIDCSSRSTAKDITFLIDILRGTASYPNPWLNRRLPASCPPLPVEPQPTPIPPDSYQAGLSIWRKNGVQGFACASCHSPDGLELAVANFADEDINRRAAFHLPDPGDRQKIIRFVHAVRQRYGILNPPAPESFRPLQPGGFVLPGDTPEECDLEFAKQLAHRGLLMMNGRVDSKAKALQALNEILAINPRTLPTCIPLNRFSEDPFFGQETTALDLADFITHYPHAPKAGEETQVYAAHDAYLQNPTQENLFTVYDQVDQKTEVPGYNPDAGYWYTQGKQLMTDKYLGLLLITDIYRHEFLGRSFANAPSDVFTYRNPIYRTGILSETMWRLDPQTYDHLWFLDPFYQIPPGHTLAGFSESIRLPWLYLGWLMDLGFETAEDHLNPYYPPTSSIFLSDWLYLPETDNTSFENPIGYPTLNAFYTAWKNFTLARQNPPHPFVSQVIWEMSGFLSPALILYRPIPSVPIQSEPRTAEHRALFQNFTRNLFATMVFLANDQIPVWTHQDALRPLERIREYFIHVEQPSNLQASIAPVEQLMQTIAPTYLPPPTAPDLGFLEDPFVSSPFGETFVGTPLLSDLDGDQDADVAIPLNNQIAIYSNSGNGLDNQHVRFVPSEYSLADGTRRGFGAKVMAFGNFTRDRYADLAVTGYLGGKVGFSVWVNDGTGNFPADRHFVFFADEDTTYNREVWTMAVLDLDRDGLDDICITDSSNVPNMTVFRNTGQPGSNWFVKSQEIHIPYHFNHQLVVGDFNGDQYPDLVTNATKWNENGKYFLWILLNDRQGNLVTHSLMPTTRQFWSLAVGDFTGDGQSDIAAVDSNSTVVEIFKGSGNGSFSHYTNTGHSLSHYGMGARSRRPAINQKWSASRTQLLAMIPVDIDGDGDLDLVVRSVAAASYYDSYDLNNFMILHNQGDGSRWATQFYDVRNDFEVSRGIEGNPAAGDLNLDGNMDIIQGFNKSSFFTVWYGKKP